MILQTELKNAIDDDISEQENPYENFIVLPEIKSGILSKPKEEIKVKFSERFGKLPSIDYKEGV